MGGLFSMDGKLAQFMSKLADVILLNVLLVACSIPILISLFYFITFPRRKIHLIQQ